MASTYQEAKITGFDTYFPISSGATASQYREIYEQHRHAVYSLAFWMTDNELAAEELMHEVFARAFALEADPDAEAIDRALIAALKEQMLIGPLTLDCQASDRVESVRRNTMRIHLERAVVQLPATERLIFLMHDVEGYGHTRIASLLGLSDRESQEGLHQARLRMRELLAAMVS